MDEKRAKLYQFALVCMATLKMGTTVYVLFTLIGVSSAVELSFNPDHQGYQLRSPFTKMTTKKSTRKQEHILIPDKNYDTIIKVSHGPFSANSSLLNSNLFNAADVLQLSVNIINAKVTQDEPVLQVIAYSNQLGSAATEQKWCFHLYVNHGHESVVASCVLTNSLHLCMLKAGLPTLWWDAKSAQSAGVYYTVKRIRERWQCTSARNNIVPNKRQHLKRVPISRVNLVNTESHRYRRVKEDQNILLDVPTRTYYPGSKFTVPVHLQAESDLRLFVIRVRARHGLKIVNAHASNLSKWHINLDMNHKQKGATVTAFVKDEDTYSKLASIQEIFRWEFEVESSSLLPKTGRLVFSVEYEATGSRQQNTGKKKIKVISHVTITSDATRIILPIAKTREILNTAVLTGRHLTFPIKVYAISHQGQISEVTRQAKCRSEDTTVLKVSPSCSVAYVEGKETKGSDNLTIFVKYGGLSTTLHFTVWFPELPLEISLSDTRLSPIKGWRVPRHRNKRASGKRKGMMSYLKSHPRSLLKGKLIKTDTNPSYCHPMFQHSVVEVYARFNLDSAGSKKKIYLPSKKAALKVTELVQDRLRIADTSIAELNGHVVHGKMLGRTEVQVVSSEGRIIGVREVRVIGERVAVKNLLATMVSGLSVDLLSWQPMPNTYIATIRQWWKLQHQYQEGTLNVRVQFTDNTVLPLKHIASNNYILQVTSLNKNIVRVGRSFGATLPRIIALRQGKGELLKVSLDSYYSCRRKKSRSLAVSYVNIDVDFADSDKHARDRLQNDGHYVYLNRANNDRHSVEKNNLYTDKSLIHPRVYKPLSQTTVESVEERPLVNIPLDIDLGKLGAIKKPNSSRMKENQRGDVGEQVQKEEVSVAATMTPLEIGMYVLLAVFCVAIIVFMANCIVFVMKYRRKRVPKGSMESIAQARDWVWLGRTTLERNSVKTQPLQTLMPQDTFDGDDGYLTPRGSMSDSPRNSVSSRNSRHSTVSTYKGAECSIRITTNPVADTDSVPCVPDDLTNVEDTIQWDSNALGMTHEELVDYFHQLKESTA